MKFICFCSDGGGRGVVRQRGWHSCASVAGAASDQQQGGPQEQQHPGDGAPGQVTPAPGPARVQEFQPLIRTCVV